MSSHDQLAERLTFDDILEAVQESKRGRWFLAEFQNRIKKQDSGAILGAIEKLESRLEGMSGITGNSAELTRARTAIAAARQEIAKLAPVDSGLSAEGRLFASLAVLARNTLQQSATLETTTAIAPGIVRALQLVDELDNNLNGAQVDAKLPADNFFKQDATLFERAPGLAKPMLVSSDQLKAVAPPTKPKMETEDETGTKGAKLIIKRTGIESAETSSPPAIQQAVESDPVIVAEAAKPEPVATEPQVAARTTTSADDPHLENPRIVIIRRKPEEMADVPMMSQQKTESAA